MTTRIDVLNSLNTQFNRIDGRTSPWDANYTFNYQIAEVCPHFQFLDEINAFPALMFTIDNEVINHIGGNIRYSTLDIEIRGYVYDEETLVSSESLAEDVEHVLQYVRQTDARLEEVRLLEVETDSGESAPYGSLIMKLQVLFQR